MGTVNTLAQQVNETGPQVQPVVLVDSSGNPIGSSNPNNINIQQIGGVAAQMGASAVPLGNALMFVQGLYDLGTNLYPGSGSTSDTTDPWRVELVNAGLFNGSNMERARGNLDNITLLASGVITSSSNSTDQTNYNACGVKVYIKTGSFGASESTMTVTIQGKDPVSNTYYTILQSASLTASSFVVLTVYPGVTASANVSVSDALPRTWRVAYAASNWGTGGSTLGISCGYTL